MNRGEKLQKKRALSKVRNDASEQPDRSQAACAFSHGLLDRGRLGTTLSAVAALALVLSAPACDSRPASIGGDVHGYTQLHHLVREGDAATIKQLLLDGAAPDPRDADGVTPLHRAARDDQLAVANVLLQYGADPTLKTDKGWDALHLAAWQGNAAMARLLLQHGAIANRTTPQGWSVLHLAAMKGHDDVAGHVFLKWSTSATHGEPDVNARDARGETPLSLALGRAQFNMALFLLAEGADPNLAGADGRPPLLVAAEAGYEEVAMALLTHGADPRTANAQGERAAQVALAEGHEDLARRLAQAGAR